MTLKGGDYVNVKCAGLPDINGTFANDYGNTSYMTGAFYVDREDISSNSAQAGGERDAVIGFKASLSNNIFGSSDTVQPQSIQLLPQIKY